MCIYLLANITLPRIQVFDQHENFHTDSIKLDLFKKGTSLLLKLDCYLCIYIYIYHCNELIEETAGLRKLIFGMWESFGYGSSKF